MGTVRKVIALTALTAAAVGVLPASAPRAEGPPNVVFIVTDDQRYDDLAYMPKLRALVTRAGAKFSSAYVSNAICCPSRSTMLTGRYSHGTGVYSNFAGDGYGAWDAFRDDEADTLATRLQGVGYRTGLFGKYINSYDGSAVPPGWSRWAAFADTGNPGGAYYSYVLVDETGAQEIHNTAPSDYSTDVLGAKVVEFITSTPATQPLFAMYTPFAPHGPSTPAPAYAGTLSGAAVSHPPNYNAVMSDPPPYLATRPAYTDAEIRNKDGRRRVRWETLRSVDDRIGDIVAALETTGRLANTLIVFVSDNGQSIGEHRWDYKIVPYTESGKVPLMMRWDGVIPAGVTRGSVVGNVDIPATILDAAGIADAGLDGKSILPLATAGTPIRNGLLLEHLKFRDGDPETFCGWQTSRYLYVRDITGFEELYDRQTDPWQMTNLAPSGVKPLGTLRQRTREACVPLPPGMAPF
jgi:arylsulfatase A-like enzyme